MPDGDTNENIRNSKRAYRKKAFQTNYSLKGDGVNASPVPYSSYSTETSVATQPQRAGIDPGTYKRPVRPSIENLNLHPNNIDSKSYPWHLVPKSDSSNLIQRQVINLTTILQPAGAATAGFLNSGQFVDLLVINANDDNILGTQTWSAPTGAAAGTALQPVASSLPSTTPPTLPTTASTAVGGGAFTPASTGVSFAGTSAGGLATGVVTAGNARATAAGRKNELYLIAKFGHTLPTLNGAATALYQIWVDGELSFSWNNFQWAAVTPPNQMWSFEIPLVCEKQIVFRVVNVDGGGGAGVDTLTGNVQASFVGWSEQQNGFTDTNRQGMEGGV
jgi:uncharacterized membrane protein|tara:strand:+ start:7031 stop:8029 length:999 start_codon:yes stop_codon:yes gene_type:complete